MGVLSVDMSYSQGEFKTFWYRCVFWYWCVCSFIVYPQLKLSANKQNLVPFANFSPMLFIHTSSLRNQLPAAFKTSWNSDVLCYKLLNQVLISWNLSSFLLYYLICLLGKYESGCMHNLYDKYLNFLLKFFIFQLHEVCPSLPLASLHMHCAEGLCQEERSRTRSFKGQLLLSFHRIIDQFQLSGFLWKVWKWPGTWVDRRGKSRFWIFSHSLKFG